MPGATLTTLANILKRHYLPPYREQLNNGVYVLSKVSSGKEFLYGSDARIPLHTERSAGISARAESGTLADAGNQGWQILSYDLVYPCYGRVRLTGPSIERTSSNVGAFLTAMKSEMDFILNDMKKDLARQCYGDGTAAIEVASNGSSSTTVTLSTEVIRKGQVYAGMVADIGTAANYDSKLAADAVVSVDESAGTVVMTSASDLSSGGPFYIIRSLNALASTTNYEINNGLSKLVNTTAGATVGGLSSTTYPVWDNNRDTAGGALTEDRMIQLYNLGIAKGADVEKYEILTSLGGLRQFYNLKVSQVRYEQPKVISGGFSVLDFMGRPLVGDYEAPYGEMRFLDWSHLFEFSNRDFHFLDEDGDTWKWVSGVDAYEAVLTKYMELGADRRNVHSVLTFTDTTGV